MAIQALNVWFLGLSYAFFVEKYACLWLFYADNTFGKGTLALFYSHHGQAYYYLASTQHHTTLPTILCITPHTTLPTILCITPHTTLPTILCITPHTTLINILCIPLPHHPNSHYAVNSIICICIIMILTLTMYQHLTLLLHLHLHHCWAQILLGLDIVDAGVACTCRVMLLQLCCCSHVVVVAVG